MRDVVFIAWQNVDAQHQPQAGQHVGVVSVGWPARFGRIVTDFGAFLMPVQSLHGAVHVEHARLSQRRARAIIQVIVQPGQAFGLVDLGQAAAHRVLANDLAHPKQRRVNWVAAQRGHMRIPAMARQHRQHHSAKQVSLLRGVRTAERQWAIGDPGIEQSGLLQVIDEEW